LPDQLLYLKISKLSRSERAFIRDFKNSERTLRIYPPRQDKELQYSDITFWTFIQQFASTFVIVVRHSGDGDEDAKNHLRRAHQFIQMLPFKYVKNRKLSISWQGSGDLNEFVPFLRRGETFFSPSSIKLSNSSLILNKNTKILTFIMGAEELHLEKCKISLSEVSNETNYVRTLRRLVMDGCEETVNFVQGLGESEELVLRDTVIKLA
jgi:hypothetical protein